MVTKCIRRRQCLGIPKTFVVVISLVFKPGWHEAENLDAVRSLDGGGSGSVMVYDIRDAEVLISIKVGREWWRTMSVHRRCKTWDKSDDHGFLGLVFEL